MTQGLDSQKSFTSRLINFYHEDHLNKQMGEMYQLDRKGFDGQARKANFRVLALDLGGFFFNTVTAPALTVAQPGALLFRGGLTAVEKIVGLTKLDTDKAVSRRKLIHILPTINKHVPSIADLGRTILNIFKYALAFFASLTIGFISVEANLWVHHKLGLICNPNLIKDDRKNEILKAVQNREGLSLAKGNLKRFSSAVVREAEKNMRQRILGHNQYERFAWSFGGEQVQRKEIVLDDNCPLRVALDKATQEKRENAKKEKEVKLGRELTAAELELIKAKYWKNLSDPFSFEINDDLAPHYQEFLSEYFNWEPYKNDKIHENRPSLPFKSKLHFKKYMKDFENWNLTKEEEVEKVREEVEKTEESSKKWSEAYKEATKKITRANKKNKREIIEIEKECSEFDQRITNAIMAKEEELNRELTALEIDAVNERIQTLLDIENLLLEKSKNQGRNLTREEVDQIIGQLNDTKIQEEVESRSKQIYPRELTEQEMNVIIKQFQIELTPEELIHLQTFGLTAMETAEQKIKEMTEAYKKRPSLMPAAHYYDLKNIVMRQLKRDFLNSTFDRLPYDLQTDENVNEKIMGQVQAKIDQMLADWKGKYKSVIANEENFALQEQQLINHLNKIERPRLYEKLILETVVTTIENETVKGGFAVLDKEREIARQAFFDQFFIKNKKDQEVIPHEMKLSYRNEIETLTCRKDNEDNKPIDKDTIIPNKEWAKITIELDPTKYTPNPKIFDISTQVTFEHQSRIRQSDGSFANGDMITRKFTIEEIETQIKQKRHRAEIIAKIYRSYSKEIWEGIQIFEYKQPDSRERLRKQLAENALSELWESKVEELTKTNQAQSKQLEKNDKIIADNKRSSEPTEITKPANETEMKDVVEQTAKTIAEQNALPEESEQPEQNKPPEPSVDLA